MFKNKKTKDTEVDISSLNHILHTGRRLISIVYFMTIILLVLIATYLLQEWHLIKYIGEFFKVISPIFIGFIIAWLCDPFVKFLQSKKLPRVLSCIIVYLTLILGLSLIAVAIVPSLVSQVAEFAGTLPALLEELKNMSDGLFNNLGNDLISASNMKEQVYAIMEGLATDLTTNLPQTLFSIGKTIISGGLSVVLGLMIGFYVLFDFDKVGENICNMLPVNWRDDYQDLVARINSSLRSYVQGLLSVMFLVFITQTIGLTIAGLKAPLVFALFCALTDIIPYFGPYIGAIPAVIVGFTISPLVGICCIISIVIVQLLENNFYQPLIMGHTMKLHPVTIMIGLLVFQHFFGIIGMIIATPSIACLKVIISFINEKVGLVEKVTGEE